MKRSITSVAMIALMAVNGYAKKGPPLELAGVSCQTPPPLHCPEAKCPSEMVIEQGTAVEPKTGRKFFLDYPCDLKRGEKVTFILSLHGAGSYGNWQRHYFPIMDYKDKYRLVTATPNSPTHIWSDADDEYLQNIVDLVYEQVGKENIKAFWLVGHSQGGMTSNRLVRTDFFSKRVDGWLSLSGGRLGGSPGRSGNFGPPRAGAPGSGGRAGAPGLAAAAAALRESPAADFSFIYETGEYEMDEKGVPETSAWAAKYNCGPRIRRADVIDTKAGYVYDSTRQNPGSDAWGRLPRPGKAEVFEYPHCKDGRVVADVVRIGKGHTEGLEPHVTEQLVKLMLSAKSKINSRNVSQLRQAWIWKPGETDFKQFGTRPGMFENTPLMIDNVLYLSTPYNRVIALDPETGAEIWAYDPKSYEDGQPPNGTGYVHRGVAAWRDGGKLRIFLNSRYRLICLDAKTGKPVNSFGDNGVVDLSQGLVWAINKMHYTETSPPVVYKDLVILGNGVGDRLVYHNDPPGDVRAFDARTGKRVWSFHTIRQAGEFGNDTWGNESWKFTGHTNVWAPFTLDARRGLVYLPVSTPSNDFFGGYRPGNNLFGESLVCLDANTGVRKWHFQIVHHGLWDYDLASPPTLVTITVDGKKIDAVVQLTKEGFAFVFDRVTGKPVWPIEERPVPSSDVPGEHASPTQPFPTKPPALSSQGVTLDDAFDLTPELKTEAQAEMKKYRIGPPFTPPSARSFGRVYWAERTGAAARSILRPVCSMSRLRILRTLCASRPRTDLHPIRGPRRSMSSGAAICKGRMRHFMEACR